MTDKAPATQLYWKDLVTDQALGRCSWGARGAWLWVLAVLHQSDEYGVVRFPLKELANSAHVPIRLLHELVQKNVLKGGDEFDTDFMYTPTHAGRQLEPVVLVKADGGSCWFCARFVRDAWRRGRQGQGSRFTKDNQPSRSPTRRNGGAIGNGAASASAFASSTTERNTNLGVLGAGADELARALQDVGYADCSPYVPELIEARESGLTAQELQAIALEKPGKPIAYLVAAAIGKRGDRIRRNGSATAPKPVDPVQAEVATKLHALDDERLQIETDLRFELIAPEVAATRLSDLRARRKQLEGALS